MPDHRLAISDSVPDWLIEHPQLLATFEALGIDYCCAGKSLEFACRERNLDARTVLEQADIRPANDEDKA